MHKSWPEPAVKTNHESTKGRNHESNLTGGAPEYRDNFMLRGPKALPVAFETT